MVDPGKHHSGTPGDDRGDPSVLLLERLAHDLRGPLSPLQTAAFLLRRDDIDPERQQELLEIIDRQTTRLSGMVQEVSDWMRARQSRLVDRREPVGVPMLVELACAATDPTVRLDLPDTIDAAEIDGDAQRLVQMLSTLVGFMQARAGEAGIVVRVASVDDGVQIVLEAPGAPWTDGERDGLFRGAQAVPFDEGLGMRLLVSQAIAEAHGGELSAVAPTTDGARLEVRLPLSD